VESDSPQRSELSDFLALHLGLPSDSLAAGRHWAASGNTIGSLALRLGTLTLEEVEQVIDLQATGDQRFGEVAVRLGYLNEAEVEGLLALQSFHRWLDMAGPLLLQRKVGIEPLVTALLEFARANGLAGVEAASPEDPLPRG